MGDGENNDIAGNNAVIRPEIAASQSVCVPSVPRKVFGKYIANKVKLQENRY
jgi:hypothetical protein